MELSLFQGTLLFSLAFLLAGGSLLLKYRPVAALARAFPRSSQAGMTLMALALLWTGWKIFNLGAADYGDYRQYILIAFGVLGLMTFKYAPDFLSVRAASILYLYIANWLLDSAWMEYGEPLRLFMVAPLYLGIALSLYLAYAPYRLRDFFGWLFSIDARAKRMAAILAVYGLLLSGIAFAY